MASDDHAKLNRSGANAQRWIHGAEARAGL
jgi:hypothetical protein